MKSKRTAIAEVKLPRRCITKEIPISNSANTITQAAGVTSSVVDQPEVADSLCEVVQIKQL